MEQFVKEKLTVKVLPTREEMGKEAAKDAAEIIQKLLQEKEHLYAVFAAAPSQNEFLAALAEHREIDFTRITAFHMDEYLGLAADAPQGFGNFLKRHIFEKCPFAEVHYLNGQAKDPEQECIRYAKLLQQVDLDLVFLGIGENGHIAFNDPSVADFEDPKMVKVVALEETCRQQQVNDGCFADLNDVPRTAITLTIPTLVNATYHLCIVPSALKAKAVHDTVMGPVSTECPASILRKVDRSVLYLEKESASLL